MDPRERLSSGVKAMHDGRYAEALADFVWFHDNALKHEPSMYGVRLSFALGDWVDLCSMYPPALKKLKSVRDKKMQAISRGKGNWDLFHDITSINEYLEEEQLTCDLFQHLDQANPELAKRCASLAFDALVRCGAYEIAHRYFPDTEDTLLRLAEDFNDDLVRHASKPAPHGPRIRRVRIQRYCEKVQMTAAVLRNVSQPENAAYALQWGAALVEDASARKKVQGILSMPAAPFRTSLV